MSPNPTPKSPATIFTDSAYKVMNDYQAGSWYPSADEIIVRHNDSNTYWRAVYRVREDDSDADCPAVWRQVMPKKVTITKYEDVK